MMDEVSGKEKAERIAQLRMINDIARKRHPEFSDEFDAMLLEAEDVASDAVQ
jgi:hypothetical protein